MFDEWLNTGCGINLNPYNVDVDNANDVLYLSVTIQLCRMLKKIEETLFLESCAQTRTSSLRTSEGYFSRFTYDRTITNSHDNYDAIAAISSDLATEICEAGELNGWDFNLKPDMELNFSTLRQPGTIAFEQLCAKRKPYLLNFICLLGGILVGSFSFKSHVHHITWLRCNKLISICEENKHLKTWSHIVNPLLFFISIFDLASQIKFGNRHQAVVNYYENKSHPNVVMALELIRSEK